jgi:hypothetical protein
MRKKRGKRGYRAYGDNPKRRRKVIGKRRKYLVLVK